MEQLASSIHFFCLWVGEVFLKPRLEACFCELKMVATSEEFTTHEFDIQAYLYHLLSYLQRKNCTQKRKDPNPKAKR